jgi:hypothetical protein
MVLVVFMQVVVVDGVVVLQERCTSFSCVKKGE